VYRRLVSLSATVSMTLVLAGCGDRSPGRIRPPSPLFPSPTAPAPPPASSWSPEGFWRGSSIVESISGAPTCIAPFWHPSSTDDLSADINPGPRGLDMVLHQQASEGCHVQISTSADRVTGGPWPYDEFDCAIAPSLCGLGCHFRLNASEWNCEGTPPEVWILDVHVIGTVNEESPGRMQGTMEIHYDHRAGDARQGGGYSGATVVTRFDIRRVVFP
jgi:hypothetical protein